MKAIGKIFVSLLALFALFAFGFSWRDLQRSKTPDVRAFGSLLGIRPQQPKVAPVKVFRSAFQHISTDFAGTVDPVHLKYAGLSGMMASLGDPHTMFMEPRMAKEFKDDTRAQFAGVGARLGTDALGAKVGVVFEEGPANRAGLRAGDLITAVDGKSVSGLAVEEIVTKIRGPVGSRVHLTVVRTGIASPIQITITRAQITTPTVSGKMLDEGIGYITISMFSEPTAMQFERAFDKLDREGMNGLVIDLRGNPGGLLESVRDILSLFIENKPAVTLKMRDGAEERTITLVGKKRAIDFPVVILVNEDSASAAEIMAGVMRDYRLTTLVGEHTYGKASVQNVIPFRDGSSAKITIARYYLPSGDDIGRKVDEDGVYVSGGIKVDVEVKLQETPLPVLGEPATDNQLARAIAVAKEKSRKRFSQRSQSSSSDWAERWLIA